MGINKLALCINVKLILTAIFLIFINKLCFNQDVQDSGFVSSTLRLASSALQSSELRILTLTLKDEIQISFEKKINKYSILNSNIRQELAFVNFYDSITRKEFDRFFWETIITTNDKGQSIFSFTYDGPLFPTYSYSNIGDSLIKEKIGNHFSPSTISVGYGLERKIFKNSRIKICYFAFDGKLQLKEKDFTDDHNYLFMGKEQYFKVDYSMNIVVDIREKLAKNLNLKSFLTINACGLSQKSIILKYSNEFYVQVTDYLDIILSTKVDYNPMISFKFVYINEMCINYHIGKKFKFK